MTASEAIESYLQISDVMLEALKARKYEIFEDSLQEREMLIQLVTNDEEVFSAATLEEKTMWQEQISVADKKLQIEMEVYRNSMEAELSELRKEQGKLRKQGSVNRYSSSQEQGLRFDKIK